MGCMVRVTSVARSSCDGCPFPRVLLKALSLVLQSLEVFRRVSLLSLLYTERAFWFQKDEAFAPLSVFQCWCLTTVRSLTCIPPGTVSKNIHRLLRLNSSIPQCSASNLRASGRSSRPLFFLFYCFFILFLSRAGMGLQGSTASRKILD